MVTATVQLNPSRFARLLGARIELVDLVATERWYGGEVRWRSVTTGRDLREMAHGALIGEALERRPLRELPVAIVSHAQ